MLVKHGQIRYIHKMVIYIFKTETPQVIEDRGFP